MNLFLFFYQGTVYSDYWSKKKKLSFLSRSSFFISVLSVVLLGIFLFFPSLSVLTWLCTRLLIVLISSAGALYLQWYQCETCILLILWLSGSVMFTCTDFWFCFHLSLSPPSLHPPCFELIWLLPHTPKGNGTASKYDFHRFTHEPVARGGSVLCFARSLSFTSTPARVFSALHLFLGEKVFLVLGEETWCDWN